MLILRKDQLKAMAGQTTNAFKKKAVAHLQRQFPRQCGNMSEADLESAAEHALQRGDAHGFEFESDLLRYLNLMFIFGKDFDQRQDLPWAAPILSRPGGTEKMDILYAAALKNESKGAGYSSFVADAGD